MQKCLQFQNINRGVDISNYYSYETFSQSIMRAILGHTGKKWYGTLYIAYEISRYCQSQKTVWACW